MGTEAWLCMPCGLCVYSMRVLWVGHLDGVEVGWGSRGWGLFTCLSAQCCLFVSFMLFADPMEHRRIHPL